METEKQFPKQKGWRLVTQLKTEKSKPQFQCRHLRQGRWLRVLQYRWNYCRTAWSVNNDSKYRKCNSTSFLHLLSFFCQKIRFKTQVTTCSDFLSDAVVKVVEMVDSWDEFESSRSVSLWEGLSKFSRCWSRRLLRLWTRSSQNFQFKRKVGFEEQKSQIEDVIFKCKSRRTQMSTLTDFFWWSQRKKLWTKSWFRQVCIRQSKWRKCVQVLGMHVLSTDLGPQYDRFLNALSYMVWKTKIQDTGLKFWFSVGSCDFVQRAKVGNFEDVRFCSVLFWVFFFAHSPAKSSIPNNLNLNT